MPPTKRRSPRFENDNPSLTIHAGRDIGSVTAVDAKAPGALVIGNVAGNVVQGVPEGDGEQAEPTD